MARTQMADEDQTANQEAEEVSEDFGIVKLLKMVIRFCCPIFIFLQQWKVQVI